MVDYKKDAEQKIEDAQETLRVLLETLQNGQINSTELLKRLHYIKNDLERAKFLIGLS